MLVFREVKAEKGTGVGLVGPTSKANCWVGGENGLVWDSGWNVNGWNAAIGEFSLEIEGGAVACTGSESDLSVYKSILQARSNRIYPAIGVRTVVFKGTCRYFLIVTYIKSPVYETMIVVDPVLVLIECLFVLKYSKLNW